MSAAKRKKKPLPKRIAGAILRMVAARPQGRPKLRPDQLKRVLLIRYDRLGDMVITTPLIDALRRLAPQAEIDVLASWRNAALIEKDPRIHAVYRWDGSPIRRLRTLIACRQRKYDVTFQLILWRTTLPGLLAGMLTPQGRVVSRDDSNNRTIFDHTYKVNSATHYSEQVYGFLEAGLDIHEGVPEMPPYSLHIHKDQEQATRETLQKSGLETASFILLNISAGEKERELTHEQNVHLVRELLRTGTSRGLKVVITGSPGDRERAQHISEAISSKDLSLFFGTLPEVLVAIREACCIITPDTGTNHLASALQTPTVAFFTRDGRPVGWGPRVTPHRIVQAAEGNNATAIDVNQIVTATEDILREVSVGNASAHI